MRAISLAYAPHADLADLLEQAEISDSQGTLIQVFAATPDQKTIHDLAIELRQLLPAAQIIGTSTAGIMHQGSVKKISAVINILQFSDATVNAAHVGAPAESQTHARSQCFESGKRLSSLICDDDTRLIFCYASGHEINGENLARGLVSQQPSVTLAGGLASPPSDHATPWVFADDRFYTSGIAAAAISGNIHIDAFHSPDWMMLGTPMYATEVRDNRLNSISNTPAKQVYARYLGNEPNQGIENICARFPLLTKRNGKVFARACNQSSQDSSLTLWGNVQEDEEIRFGILDPVSAMDAFHGYTRKIQEHGSQALYMFPSLARKMLMRSLTDDEARQLNSLAPTTGCFCSSQFFYQPSQQDYLHYAQTIISIRESDFSHPSQSDPETLEEFSQDTLQLRAMSHLVGSTTREMEENTRLLEELASIDSLTHALNRHKMQILLEQEYKRAQRYGRPLSLIMFDIDDFKRINDEHGHQIGDRVLETIASVVQETIRDTDYLSRWGGEEFLVLCPETDLEGTYETAERIRHNIEKTLFPEGNTITASLGVTAYQQEDTLDRLLHRVDRALYLSKDKGKNRVTRWS
ncbi:MAG: sensor domain-containing diguanylate cyclase [bacterium]